MTTMVSSMRSLLAVPSRLLLIAAVVLIPAHLCCCLTQHAEAATVAQMSADEHSCCSTTAPQQPTPTEDHESCECADTHLTTPDEAPAIVTTSVVTHLFDLPVLHVAVLSDLAVSPRPLTASFDTPPPRSTQTLRAQHCLLLI